LHKELSKRELLNAPPAGLSPIKEISEIRTEEFYNNDDGSEIKISETSSV
jgi:hypothetical protein